MDDARFSSLKYDLCYRTTPKQLLEIEQAVRRTISLQLAETALVRRADLTTKHRCCPHCQSQKVVLHGKDKNDRQRFKCRNCTRTYNILTGTPIARARKPWLWGQYLSCVTDFMSVRRIKKTGIELNHITIWRWRHRFLTAAVNDNAKMLSGIIEADETFFLRSFKGSRGWKKGIPPENRIARPSGWGATSAGLSNEFVPVLSALDNTGGMFDQVLETRAGIGAALDGRIAKGSVLCSDGAPAYVKAAKKAGAEHRRIDVAKPDYLRKMGVKKKNRKTSRLGLGRFNAHHGRVKKLVNLRCRGVASKYLPSYLGWNRAMSKNGFHGKNLLNMALALS